jgi:serine/threonine protein kinase
VTLSPGTRLGVYAITEQIGEGGMGQVFEATDTNLALRVAIKVLPEAFAQDVDRLARFEREAITSMSSLSTCRTTGRPRQSTSAIERRCRLVQNCGHAGHRRHEST